MHLADRRRREGRAIEAREHEVEILAPGLVQDLVDLVGRHRRHRVLELPELGDQRRRQQVGARRRDLAELDERGAEILEHAAQPDRERIRRRDPLDHGDRRADQRQATHQLAEPVLDEHRADLGEALRGPVGAHEADHDARIPAPVAAVLGSHQKRHQGRIWTALTST